MDIGVIPQIENHQGGSLWRVPLERWSLAVSVPRFVSRDDRRHILPAVNAMRVAAAHLVQHVVVLATEREALAHGVRRRAVSQSFRASTRAEVFVRRHNCNKLRCSCARRFPFFPACLPVS